MKYSFVILLSILLVGCKSNMYEENYSVISDEEHVSPLDEPKLIEIISKKQINELTTNKNLILIGKSDFKGAYIPRTFVIDCAKKHGAAIVAVELGKGEVIEYDSIVYAPTSSTTYHSGAIYDSYYPGGYYNYSGTSTTYGSTPILVKRKSIIYPQTAYFYVERKYNNNFGVSFQLPENTPGNKDVTVRVLSVKKGSQAEKLGIKTKDIVKSINGEKITSPNDIQPYIDGTKKIKTIEVSHE